MQSQFKIRIEPPDERALAIALRSAEAVKNGAIRQEHKFRAGKEPLALISLPLTLPIYRLENYRTRDQQLSMEAGGKVPTGFFDPARSEDPSVQQSQHDLLLIEAKKGSGESIKPIYDELERVREQTDPLIITDTGVVVNGNRRLCAMRELWATQAKEFPAFEVVQCLVLPKSALPAEILELEIRLQMQPETKLPYEWTAIGRAVRDLRKTKEDDEIARIMNRDKTEVQRAAKMIEAADLYLSEWLQKPGAYGELDGTEQAFKQVAARNWGRADEADLREQTRKFDFFVIENRNLISESAYSLINSIELNPRLFLRTLAADWDMELKPRHDEKRHKFEFDEPEAEQIEDLDYSPLTSELAIARKNPSAAKARVDSLVNVCAIVGEQGKEREKAALKFARQAERSLSGIYLRGADPATYGEIAALLAKCEEICESLLGELASLKASKS
jgi:hypothetical protein